MKKKVLKQWKEIEQLFFYSENAEVAKLAIDNLREKKGFNGKLFFDVTVRDMKQNPDETKNPFVFSDGTGFKDEDFLYQWNSEPTYNSNSKCVIQEPNKKIYEVQCESAGKAVCFVDCPNSGSERFHANLPFYGLLVAGSVFNAFHALAGLVF